MLTIVHEHAYYDRPIAGIARIFESRYVFFILIDMIETEDVFAYVYLDDHYMFQLLMNKIGVRELLTTAPVFVGFWDTGLWIQKKLTENELPAEEWYYNLGAQ